MRELSIHHRLSGVDYPRRCANTSSVKAHQKRGFSLAPGMEIGYVVRYAAKWEVDREISPDLMLCIVGGCRKRHEVSFSLKDTYY